VRAYAVTALLAPTLLYLTTKFFDSAVGKIAGVVIEKLTPLIGSIF